MTVVTCRVEKFRETSSLACDEARRGLLPALRHAGRWGVLLQGRPSFCESVPWTRLGLWADIVSVRQTLYGGEAYEACLGTMLGAGCGDG